MTGALNARDDRRARRKQSQRASGAYGEESTFINRELTQEETAELRIWRNDIGTVDHEWGLALADGYKINTKHDDYNDCFAAFALPGEGSSNSGYILVGRGGTPYRAVAQLLYKHAVIFCGAWTLSGGQGQGNADPDF